MKIKNKFYHFIVSIILVVSLLAGTIVPANTIVKADDNNPTIWTSYEQSNGVVTIHYYGTGITNLSSYQMLIKYDNEKLSYKECKFSSELGSTITSAKESQGTVKIALINGNGLSVSDKELFAITYTADFVGSEQCVFNTNINEAYDRNLSNIDFNIDSQLTINVDNPLSDNYQVNLKGTTDANANDTVQCRFGFSHNAGVMSGSFILHYNEEQVRFQKVTANKNAEGLIVSYNKVEEGTVKVAYAFNKCSTTTMKFLNMEFIPLEKSTYSYISLTDVVVTNEQLQECVFEGSYKTSISTLDSQSDNLFTVNGPDSIDSQETFDVTIDLAGNSGIAAMTASLEYDSDIFEIQSSSFSESILKNSFTNASTSNKGKVKFAFMSTDDIKADGQVIKLTFKAIKNENVSGKFQLVVDELTDSNATKQEYNIADLTTKVNKICIHNYIGPDFQWSDDYSICKAVYTCEYNSEHVIKVDCDVETTRTEATCEEDGNITHTATGTYNDQKITDVQKETIPARGHVKGKVKIENATESTCEKGGSYDEVVYCTVCNKELSRTTVKTEAKGHVKGEVKIENATESTCEKGGSYDEVVYCTVCNKELSRTTVKTEVKGHKWDNGKITTQPTCTEEGVKTFQCMVCGKTKTEKVSALGHNWNEDFTVDKEATCEETGLKSIHCKRCDIKKDETVIPAKGHVAGEKKIENATEAVCEAGGSYDEVVYCTVCNKEISRKTIKTEAKGHKWNEGKVTTEPTCTEEGVKTFECTVCGKTKTEKVEALGHDWNNDFTVDKEATCEETGLKSIHCKRCDIKKDETVIPAKGHVAGEKKIENATESTCENGGSYDEVIYCTVCGKELSRTTIKTEAKGHKWNEGKVTTEPTCTEEGVKTFECTVCGKTKTEKVEALGHDWNNDFTVDKEATCEETGLKSIHCKRCDERKEITTIPAKGHVKGEVKIENATESTCEKGGSYDEVVYCTVCNKELSRTTVKTEAKGHKWDNGKVTTEPTCTEEGVKTFECTVCGKTKTEKVEALGHDWNNDFTVDKEATCEETGLKSIHCKRCDIKKDETVIPAKGHVAGEKKIENATEAVCEAGGSYDEVIYCTVCNKELSRTTVKTEAKGHKWNEGKITTQPTCTEEGVKTFQCMVCGKTKTEKASALGHDWNEDFTVDKEATCEETGLKSIHCKHCDEKKDETTIPAKGHIKGEVKIENATESTCEKGGSYDEVVYCTVCNKELSRTTVKTEAKGHKWNNGKVTTEPTYAEEGVKTYTCTACGATKTEVIPKRNMEYTVGSTYQDISTNAIYRITVINQQVEYVCPIDKKLKKATIPSQIRIGNVTYKVTSIGNNAFKRCKNLSSITIGNNISKIGNKAFYNCKKLKKIKIKSKKLTLKKIGKSAFKKINKKAKISVPKSKKKSYKKMLTKKGLSKTVKIK